MFSFQFIWAFIILPLPLIIYIFTPRFKNSIEIIFGSGLQRINQTQNYVDHNTSSINFIKILLLSLAWFFLVAALANPTFIGSKIKTTPPARDIVMAIDISNSMKTRDMFLNNRQFSRDDVVKELASQFVSKRKGDRIGLILFALNAYINSPLTLDNKTIATFIKDADIGIADNDGEYGTAVGDAIALSIKSITSIKKNDNSIIILLTDGVDNSSKISPIDAAKIAAKNNIKIYTIGLGSDRNVLSNGIRVNFKSLNDIAKITGGKGFKASNPQELAQIYQIIQELEPVERETVYLIPKKQIYYWFIIAFLLTLLLIFLIDMYEKKYKATSF